MAWYGLRWAYLLQLFDNSMLRIYYIYNLDPIFRKESEPEVIYLKHVERQQQQQKIEEERSTKYAVPSFLTPLRDLTINEGEKAHFDAKVGPVGDPSMKVEWYFSGQLITASK